MEKIDIEFCKKKLNNFHNLNLILKDNLNSKNKIYYYPYIKQKVKEYKEFTIWGILNSTQKYWEKVFLKRLEELYLLLNEYYTKNDFKNGLISGVFSFISELEVAEWSLNNKFEIIEIEPKLKTGNKLDLKLKQNNNEFLVEVITPRLKLQEINKEVKFSPISREIEYNLFGEFEHHDVINNNLESPFIVAIDCKYMGLDELELSCALKEFKVKFPNLSNYLYGILFFGFAKSVYSMNEPNFQFLKN